MSDNKKQNLGRWQALDIMKTIGLSVIIFGHGLIFWFGVNQSKTTGATYFAMNGFPTWLLATIIIVVHFIFVSAGAAFYFYLKRRPPLKRIVSRIFAFILIGVFLGLNLHPFVIFWNAFLFYALALLVIFTLNYFDHIKTIFLLTFGALVLTPFLRLCLFAYKLIPNNYLLMVLIGDPNGQISFYPFFPWFFLIGAGFLVSHYYSVAYNKRLLTYGISGGIVASLLSIPFFKSLDFSNIFGVTSQLPVSYVIFIFGSFVSVLSALELILRKRTLSKYNPAITIGRHILPVYLVSVIITFSLSNFVKSSAIYWGASYTFLIFELIIFTTAYLIGALLTYRKNKHTHILQSIC